jgi:FkbM family methyltransferase
MKMATDGSLEKWLSQQLEASASRFQDRPVLIDVGAYHGDFAKSFLAHPSKPFERAILFEPNSVNLAELQKRFIGNSNVQIENLACDEKPGTREFFCVGPAYTGSLLPYHGTTTAIAQRSNVNCVSLDTYLEQHGLTHQIGLLKIDTQGNDLRVLRSAVKTLKSSQPWIIAELIFVPLYEKQAQPHEIANWLAAQGYTQAALFNEFYSSNGWLGWADACFVPREAINGLTDEYAPRPTAEQAARNPQPKPSRWRRWRQKWKGH